MPEHAYDTVLQHVLAKVLMLEAVQTNVIAQIAGRVDDVGAILSRVLSSAESELRLLALSDGEASSAAADRALAYLTEYGRTLMAVVPSKKEAPLGKVRSPAGHR